MKWLYLSIFGILFHMITDVLDGTVGRYRNTGAIIWGYFMDHTMDAVITFSISIALALVYPQFQFYILFEGGGCSIYYLYNSQVYIVILM